MKLPSVFVLGDSISIHYGPFLKQYLKGRFKYARKRGNQKALENLDVPTGANGGDSSMVLRYLAANKKHREIPAPVDYLLINCGLHDIKTDPISLKKQVSEKVYRRNLEKIVRIAKRMAKNVIWVRSTPVDEKRHRRIRSDFYRFEKDLVRYNKIADAMMKKKHLPVIDLYSLTIKQGSRLYLDHVHFTMRLRQKQAKFIANYLLSKVQ
jgi:lysophospholipase L1-like esterase